MTVKEIIEELERYPNTCEITVNGLEVKSVTYCNRSDTIELNVSKL